MLKALQEAYLAIEKVSAWESKRKVLICLCFLFGIDPTKPLMEYKR